MSRPRPARPAASPDAARRAAWPEPAPVRRAASRGLRPLLVATGLAAAVVGTTGQAQELRYIDTRPVRMTASIGLTGGGDRLATAYFWYRDDYTLHAGSLVQGNFGIEFDVAPAVTMAVTIGHHYDGASAWNGELRFTRWPLEVLAHARVAPHIRLGGGLRFPLSPKLRSSGDAPDVDEDFKVPVGVIAEAEYRFNPSFGLKLRGVTERYRSKQGLPTVKGDHFGLFAAFYF